MLQKQGYALLYENPDQLQTYTFNISQTRTEAWPIEYVEFPLLSYCFSNSFAVTLLLKVHLLLRVGDTVTS